MAHGHAVRAVTKDNHGHNTQHMAIIIAWLLGAGVHQAEMMTTAILIMRITTTMTPGTPGEMEDLAGDPAVGPAGARDPVVTAVTQVVTRAHLMAGAMTLGIGGPGLEHRVGEETTQETMMIICFTACYSSAASSSLHS